MHSLPSPPASPASVLPAATFPGSFRPSPGTSAWCGGRCTDGWRGAWLHRWMDRWVEGGTVVYPGRWMDGRGMGTWMEDRWLMKEWMSRQVSQ